MTEDQLLQRMLAHPAHLEAQLAQPERALRSAEAAWEDRPHDRALAGIVHAIHGRLTADHDLPIDIGSARRERLLQWDNWTTTWRCLDLQNGAPVILRALRPHLFSDAMMGRALAREGRALDSLVAGLTFGSDPIPHLRAPLPGSPLASGRQPTAPVLARLLGTAAEQLSRWQAHDILPPLEAGWREHNGALSWVGLQAVQGQDAGPHLTALGQALLAGREPRNALEDLTHALGFAPPRQASEVRALIVRALASDLAAQRHSLSSSWHNHAQNNREQRLLDCVLRLQMALPPPIGRGAVGVDLEGKTTVVEGRPDGIWWGPVGQLSPVWTRAESWDAPLARRLLRARAAAAPSARLNQEIGGDLAYPDRARRWVAAALSTRTVRLLLERS